MLSDRIVVPLMDFSFSLWHLKYKFHVFYYLLSTYSISGVNSLETLALMKVVFLFCPDKIDLSRIRNTTPLLGKSGQRVIISYVQLPV